MWFAAWKRADGKQGALRWQGLSIEKKRKKKFKACLRRKCWAGKRRAQEECGRQKWQVWGSQCAVSELFCWPSPHTRVTSDHPQPQPGARRVHSVNHRGMGSLGPPKRP